ncbi:MAG: N-acetyltransferase [Candidatus Edwardsbacteria bacterium]|nr:N-acetyltransferase [Candidatus Edwardsbacteria bacterium]MBU1576160.1 N-acetyltransferase [Candidatus Edwardsbacteria bacterium]MBU2463596.1 N-acetyltransferase [Candidatus Edwardsbacteria bacterium]MBU2593200.1 N-acetyltransferase [Candidatus Edwardsbacteria bacterium]
MPDDIIIKQAVSRADIDDFIKLPWGIYRNDPCWVPPLIAEQRKMLDTGKNAFFEHARAAYFLAQRNGQSIGRISAHIDDNSNDFHKEKCGFFGFFECIDDQNAVQALFTATGNWLKEQGMDTIRGPFNFTTNDTAGLLIDAFDSPPVIEMTYNPPYYPKLIEGCGLVKAIDFYAYFFDVEKMDGRRVRLLAERVERKGITFRSIDKKKFAQEVKIFKEVYNQAWSHNWGFVPLTEHEIDHYAENFKDIVDPDFVIFAFDGQKPVGSLWALPDYNYVIKKLNGRMGPLEMIKFLWHKRKITHARVLTAGVVSDYQHRGIEAGLISRVFENAVRKGFKTGELSWVLENNVMMNRLAEAVGSKIYKTYRVYEKKIT